MKKFSKNCGIGDIMTLQELFNRSAILFGNNLHSAVLDTGMSYTYSEMSATCRRLSDLMDKAGAGDGAKVAVLSANSPHWTMAFFSATAFGRIAVPILPESAPNEIANILEHSESSVLFVSRKLLPNVPEASLDKMSLVIDADDFGIISERKAKHAAAAGISSADDIATIIYTSGTTGNAKGVMLTHRNLMSCVQACYATKVRNESDRWLSVLPMAHTLELSIGMLYPMLVGASVYYLSKPPVPAVLLKAFRTVRPTTMLIVPLIIEKIYRNSIIPTIRRSPLLSWMSVHTGNLLCRIVGMKLKKTFGGRLDFLGIGGARLDIEVENFLLKAGFPYAVGYGLTETSPLLTYSTGSDRIPGTIGKAVKDVQLKLININPETHEGEIVAKGPNVMKGYYKDTERTAAVFTGDGWFRTGDLATVDSKGRFFIKGRLTNMILGASGENIYPEDIEQVINSIETVNESLVVSRGGKLVALVNFNEDAIDWNREGEEEFFRKIEEYKRHILEFVNRHVKKAFNVSEVQVMREPFEKTATRKIRRFKYTCLSGL